MSKPLHLIDLSLTFPHKTCFENFQAQILPGSRIGIIGRNGSGKSTLLKIIQGSVLPSDGEIRRPDDDKISYVPQLIENDDTSSGGERFNHALTAALSTCPDILLLDEPSNHLDQKNKKALIKLLNAYEGTLIMVTHDPQLLRATTDTLWHLDQGKISIFSGEFDDYQRHLQETRTAIENQLLALRKQQKSAHEALMKEQGRSSKSRSKGEKSIENRKWPTIVSQAKARRGEETSGRKQKAIADRREALSEQLQDLPFYEIIVPKFSLSAAQISRQSLIDIHDGSVTYEPSTPLLKNIHFSLGGTERVAFIGNNGSGKSSFVKALLNHPAIQRTGTWLTPSLKEIGYLDQHYQNLDPQKTVLESISLLCPTWAPSDVRKHLNDFLFRKNEEVNAKIATLSGGEKVRLSLAQIAAKTPSLLILDEVTNNLDLETRAHVIQVLKDFPGALIVISHDEDFLKEIGVSREVRVPEDIYFEKNTSKNIEY
jgi:ATPase subunit of ABC transporter with duplicated ATPase domains